MAFPVYRAAVLALVAITATSCTGLAGEPASRAVRAVQVGPDAAATAHHHHAALEKHPDRASSTIPAVQPSVQAWFRVHEPQMIELTNALTSAYAQIQSRSRSGGGCQQLARATGAVRRTVPSPVKALDAAVVAGFDDFEAAATACAAGDFATATRDFALGAGLRATARLEIDEILEGA